MHSKRTDKKQFYHPLAYGTQTGRPGRLTWKGKVVEPDQSDLRQQDERCNKRVDQLIAETGELWRSRFSTRKELLAKCGNSWSRKKSIYYDEEGIREEQIETAHYCRQCSGYLTIRTAAAGTRFGDQSAFIISLKRDTCK